tara:strand:- start:142 stop:636 length:495 start_codon:yes stop_codon:yes gene_type:complete
MKFNIEKPFSKKNIIKNRKKEKIFKRIFFLLLFMVSFSVSPFFYESIQNDSSGILESIINTIITSVFAGGLFSSVLLCATANKHNFSFKRFQYIDHKKCTDLLESTQINPEIKNYVIQVSELGRQITNYEYEQLGLYAKRKAREKEDEKHRSNCNKLYTELAGD